MLRLLALLGGAHLTNCLHVESCVGVGLHLFGRVVLIQRLLVLLGLFVVIVIGLHVVALRRVRLILLVNNGSGTHLCKNHCRHCPGPW